METEGVASVFLLTCDGERAFSGSLGRVAFRSAKTNRGFCPKYFPTEKFCENIVLFQKFYPNSSEPAISTATHMNEVDVSHEKHPSTTHHRVAAHASGALWRVALRSAIFR